MANAITLNINILLTKIGIAHPPQKEGYHHSIVYTALATMVLQFAFRIISILCSIHALASAQYPFVAQRPQPNCNSMCGTVEILYPFGMNDPKCYADKWFEIECRNTSHDQTPYLKYIDVEVRGIDVLGGTIDIMHPIYHRNCKREDAQQVVDLRGSPFVYSQTSNKFVAVGCNNIAFLVSNGTQVSGCVSICDDNENVDMDLEYGNCNGKYCCETSLPSYLSEYNVTTENLGNDHVSNHRRCSYALIVRESEYREYYSPRDFQTWRYAIAVLEWEIVNSTLKLPANCGNSNVTSSQHSHSGRTCYCPNGSNGNPYIDGGCMPMGMILFPDATQIYTND